MVLFSMATSSAEFMPRTADFLFSKNRLNVAISRARCLAYLVCTDELLDTRARDVDEMALISALSAFSSGVAWLRCAGFGFTDAASGGAGVSSAASWSAAMNSSASSRVNLPLA